jgi:hypothetical protein
MIQETATTLWMAFKLNAAKFLSICFALLIPIQFMLLLVGAFILADTIAGIWSSRKLGKKITSNRLSGFISKMLVYNAVVILAYALDVNLLGEFLLHLVSINLLFTKVTVIALIVNECYSINEKLVNVKGKGIWDYAKQVLGVAKFIKKEAKELQDDDKE